METPTQRKGKGKGKRGNVGAGAGAGVDDGAPFGRTKSGIPLGRGVALHSRKRPRVVAPTEYDIHFVHNDQDARNFVIQIGVDKSSGFPSLTERKAVFGWVADALAPTLFDPFDEHMTHVHLAGQFVEKQDGVQVVCVLVHIDDRPAYDMHADKAVVDLLLCRKSVMPRQFSPSCVTKAMLKRVASMPGTWCRGVGTSGLTQEDMKNLWWSTRDFRSMPSIDRNVSSELVHGIELGPDKSHTFGWAGYPEAERLRL